MANSLQEQLLKAGLANQKKLREVAEEKRKQAKQPKPKTPLPDEGKLRMEQELAEKQARDRALNQQKLETAKAREVAAQIKQIIEQHRISPEPGEIPYRFVDRNKVKTLYVSKKTQAQLAQGSWAITAHENGYALIPTMLIEKIQQRDPAWPIVRHTAQAAPEVDDPYAQYQVPDDLMW